MATLVTDEGSSALVARNSLSVSVPSSGRASIEEYHDATVDLSPAITIDVLDTLPIYDALVQSSSRTKFNIQPREDEGREILPPYSTTISLDNIFMKKMELEGAVHQAQDRSWYRFYVTLQGTALRFYQYKSSGIFARPGGGFKGTRDGPTAAQKGDILRSYNLRHADVGIAADYVKKRYVIRVRAEADQFLLSCSKVETFVLWLQSLCAAIDLAPPVDEREIPREAKLPRAWRFRRSAEYRNVAQNTSPPRVQTEIVSTQNTPQVDSHAEEASSIISSTLPQTPSPPTTTLTALQRRNLISRTRQAIAPAPWVDLATRLAANTSGSHPSVHPETGKWEPNHQWSIFHDMMSARRSMATLTCNSPRKSNLVIMKGQQWIIDWATGAMTRCSPPDYGEIEKENEIKVETASLVLSS